MTFARPTLTQLISRAQSDIETRLPGADAQIRDSVENVLARVVAGASHGLHGHLVWLSKQLFPDKAEDEFIVRWASIWGLSKNAAVKATGNLTLTGTTGTTCPAATQWQDTDGNTYTQDADVVLAAGTGTAALTAVTAGADGNQAVGVVLSIVTPVAGIDSTAIVSGSGLIGGVDEESTEDLLVRLLERLQTPPSGGGPGDYVAWAKEVAGTTRAWQIANANGLGSVAVYFVMDDKVGTIIPNAGEVAAVQTHVDLEAPVTADVTVYAPTPVTRNFTIHISPDTTAIRAAVQAELEDLILRVGEADGMTLYLSQINEAISIAADEVDHTTTVPAADVVYTVGQIPVFGTITWV